MEHKHLYRRVKDEVPDGIFETPFTARVARSGSDLVVEVRTDVLHEVDGPMLRYGLQEMQGVRIHTPRQAQARPDKEGLAERYEEFRAAG